MRWMWLQRIAKQLGYRTNRRRTAAAPNRFRARPSVELLEDRVNPSVLLNSTPIVLSPLSEGGSTGVVTVTVATFTDPGGPEATSDYNATINWGDGTSSPGAVVPSSTVSYFAPGRVEGRSFGVAVDAHGNVYVSEYESGVVSEFNSSGVPVNSIGSGQLFTPSGMAFDANGNLYVANLDIGTVSEFDSSGNLVNATFASDPNGPLGLAFDSSGNLYVLNSSGTVSEFNSSGGLVNHSFASGLNYPHGLAFDSSGNLYASNSFLGTVSEFNSSGTLVNASFASGLNIPGGLAFDHDGNLYVANSDSGTVSEFNASGGLVNAAYASGVGSPLALAIDSSGDLYVDPLFGGVIYKATPGLFVVTGSHAYAEESAAGTPYQISTTVQHESAPVKGPTVTASIEVDDVPVSPPDGSGFTAKEGQASSSQVLATFTDPGNLTPTGQISAVNITDGGAGYDGSTTVSFADPGNPNAAGAIGTVDVYNGAIAGVTITNPGSGYDANTTVSFSDLAGTGATGAAVASTDEPSSAYSVQVNWGDPNSNPGSFVTDPNVTISGPDAYGDYTVTGLHTYADESGVAADIQVAIAHGTTTPQNVDDPLTVIDPPLTNVTGVGAISNATPLAPAEGASGAYLLATFTDPGNPNGTSPSEVPGVDYTADINWGDGTPIDHNVTISYDSEHSVFDVYGTHTYAEGSDPSLPISYPSYTISVTVNHDDTTLGGITVADSATVSDPAVIATVGQTAASGVENQSTNTIILAKFTDPGDDGNVVSSVTMTNGGSDYEYDNGGTPIVTFSGRGGGSGAAGQAILDPYTHAIDGVVITNPGVGYASAPSVSFSDSQGNMTATGYVNITPDVEPIADYSASVNWGDGHIENTATSPNISIVQGQNNQYLVLGSHTYTEESATGSPYQIQTTVSHESAPLSNTVTVLATISDPSVNATGNFNVTAVEGAPSATQTVATFTDPAGAESTGTPSLEYSATINWGDGTATTTGTIAYSGGIFTVQGNHTYAEEGSYSIGVLLQHGTANNVNLTSTATVSDQSVVFGTTPITFTSAEGASTTQTVATFTDPGGPEGVNEYSALINWGDDTPLSAGVITYTASNQTFTVTGTHAYAEESAVGVPYAITTTVSHGTSVAVSTNDTFSANLVANPGFETGDLTGWSDPTDNFEVDRGFVHSGSFAADTGVVGSLAPLSQNITTVIGQQYTFSFWEDVYGTDGDSQVSELQAFWNGTKIYDELNPAQHGYELETFTETATSTSTPILFEVRNDPSDTFIDDVSVTGNGNPALATVTDPSVFATVGPTLTGSEGQTLAGGAVLATFTDPGDDTNPADFSATINWGAPNVAVPVPAGDITYNAGYFTIAVIPPAYVEEGSYPVTVVISHGLAPTATVTDIAVIADPSVVATATPVSATEGDSFTGTVATFTDPGGNLAAEFLHGDYTATINWGDGTATTTVTTAVTPGNEITLSGVTFTVTGTHTYAEEGSYTTSVTISHDSSPSVTVTNVATVAEVAVQLNTPAPALTPVEGQSTGQVTVATFTDPGNTPGHDDPAGDYTASINWGDGNTSVGLIGTDGVGNYTVVGAHTYAEESDANVAGSNPYDITVTVLHGGVSKAGLTATANVSDRSVILNATPLSFSAVEGSPSALQTLATFTDPAGAEVTGTYPVLAPAVGAYTAYINWGDPSAPGEVLVPSADLTYNAITQTFSVLGSYDYVEEGTYPISVTAFHGTSTGVSTQTATATVSDPAVVVTGNFSVPAQRGIAVPAQKVATFTDPGGPELIAGAPNPADYSATVSWGDSTPSVQLPASDITFTAGTQTFTVAAGGHTYTQNGNYTITVQVTHPATTGSTVTVSSFASVVDPSVILITPALTFSSLVETHISNQTVATFTDPAGAEVISGFPVSGAYTAYIDWADGTVADPDVTIGTITYTAATQTFTVKGSHTYTEESSDPAHGANADGTFHVMVTVAHGNSNPLTVNTLDATVSDPPVLANGNKSFAGTEGSAPASPWLLATFTDPAGAEPASDYSAQVNWGSSGFVPLSGAGAITFDPASGKFDVTDSHAFLTYGSFTPQVKIFHENATPVTVSDTATIADAPLTAGTLTPPIAPMNVEAPVGSTPLAQQVLFKFTDGNVIESGSNLTAAVSWGDAETDTSGAGNVSIVPLGNGAFEVMGTHVYTEDYLRTTFSVAVKDNGGAKAYASHSLVVTDPSVVLNNPALSIHPIVNIATGEMEVATFTDPGGAEANGATPTSGAYTATINWGDGSKPSSGTITFSAGTFTVYGSHKYTSITGSPYNVTVTIAHGASTPTTAITATAAIALIANQTISFALASPVTYGVSPITLTASASSGLPVSFKVISGPGTIINGDQLKVTGAGSIVVEADQGGNSQYTTATPVQHTVVVNKATLTVTANNLSKTFGHANPTLTYAIAGFVNGDPASVVTGTPTLSTTATTASNVGTYPITIVLHTLSAANYTFTLVPSTLTVNPATLTFMATSFPNWNGKSPAPTPTYSVTGYANGNTYASLFGPEKPSMTVNPSIAYDPNTGVATQSSYAIDITQGTLATPANYDLVFVDGTLTNGRRRGNGG